MTTQASRAFGIEFEFGYGSWDHYYPFTDNDDDSEWEEDIDDEVRRFERHLRATSGVDMCGWSVGTDCGGIEVRTPICTDQDWDRIIAVVDAAGDLGAYEGDEWGTHFHTDIRNLSEPQLHVLTAYWILVEPAMLRLVSTGRAHSGWCNSLGGHDRASIATWEDLRQYSLRYHTFPSKRAISFSCFGTIECRLPACTVDARHMQPWVWLMRGLVDDSLQFPDKQALLNVATDEQRPHLLLRAMVERQVPAAHQPSVNTLLNRLTRYEANSERWITYADRQWE